ncbi:hypothetical protein A2971_00790 [Candidatus Gottesmanbacteria bacterium RIFCSPLOWO2_01_FULL_46_21]|uniref:Uncharacterized protein n=1 Tax=Candidatus Gottesmanbacteria bacterium RIFCSPLOWO2_01_FULL_46_21 TaxID=1798393 RepID=A0A1F6B0F0_9BACT|nr:MAG: hypothetical protein A2971_00790 [Candidatus Gottesmanbacteria bacterium RIFCSPLOWO2_01_FULL_46_21]
MGNATRMLLFIVISSVILSPLIAPFFKPGRAWTYDVDIHAFRMAAFHNALKDGNIPPRWSSQLVYGWGSPLFSFNWSLPYWMGEPFLFAGWSVTDASKAVIILSVVLSYLFMFFFLREWFGFWPALGGTAIYEWSLYRLFLLFTGGGLGMHAAFIFWPMLFWGVLTGKKNPTRAFILICLGTAGLMLSHQVMFLMIQPLLWVFILFTVRKDMNTLTRLGGAFFAGLGLTAYFWLPAFVEQNFLHIGMTKLIVWNNFLDVQTIFHEPGITNTTTPLQYWYWSTGWNLFIIAIVACVLLFRFPKKFPINGLFALFFFIGQFLMVRASGFLWSAIPLLADFQYPVRFQSLSLFCGSILGAYVIFRCRRVSWAVCIGVVAGTIAVNSMAIPTNWPRADITDAYYYQADSTVDMMGEYLPVWANVKHFFDDSERFERHPVGRIIEGDGTIDTPVKRASTVSFIVRATSPVSVVINQFYFPGWQITASGKPVASEVYGHGEMLVHLPQGISAVSARFGDTPIRAFGNSLSLATAMVMVFWMIGAVWKKKANTLSIILILLTALWLCFNLVFFWANANIDSYFFWAFGQYLRTNQYPFLPYFTYERPTTMAPPLFSVLLVFAQLTPFPAFVIRFMQTVLLCGSGYLVYLILKKSFSRETCVVIACIFVLIPGNVVYTNYLMSEILAQFFITLVGYFFLKQSAHGYAYALFWSAVGILAKYALVMYAGFAAVLFVLARPNRKLWWVAMGAAVIILGWVSINWSITGSFGLSDLKGGHLYNNVVWVAGIVPDERTKPMLTLRRYVPPDVDIRKAYWDMQAYILPSVNRSWPAADFILGSVALEAIKEHPFAYVKESVIGFIKLHDNRIPYWEYLGTFGKPQGVYSLTCEGLGSITLCIPPVRTSLGIPLWNTFIAFSNWFYSALFPWISYGLLIPSLVFGLFSKNTTWRTCALLYLGGVLLHAMVEHHDTRYIIPFYPLMTIIIAFGLQRVKKLL